jgi:MoaA/NifB/PqqE/SkfB family radical SAM enzyme
MHSWSYTRGAGVYEIKVGYSCNNRCKHCAIDTIQRTLTLTGQKKDLTTLEITGLIDHACRMSAKYLVLTGGEITIRQDFEYLLRYAVDCQLAPIIHTNGRIFSNTTLAQRVANIPGISFVVSLHGSQAVVHDRISGCKSSFGETYQGLLNIRKHTSALAIKLVLLKQNSGEVVPTMQLAHKIGVSEFCLAFPYAVEQQISAVPRYSVIADEIKAGCLYAEELQLPMSFETIPYCIAASVPAMWKQNCDLLRSVRTQSIKESPLENEYLDPDWDHLRPELKVKGASCSQCVFNPICEGPWRDYADVFGFDEFVPVLPGHVQKYLLSSNQIV